MLREYPGEVGSKVDSMWRGLERLGGGISFVADGAKLSADFWAGLGLPMEEGFRAGG